MQANRAFSPIRGTYVYKYLIQSKGKPELPDNGTQL